MATYLSLVEKLLLYTEKIPIELATAEQQNLALRDVNDAYRYVYNNGDLSFKTVVLPGFVYVTNPPGQNLPRGRALPDDFMGFHQTGGVFLDATPTKGKLIYLPYHQIMDRVYGQMSLARGPATHYGLGGPSDPTSETNQREIMLWPFQDNITYLTLIYQRAAPDDIEDIGDADVEIPRIPATWHIPVILAMAKMFRKMDKGADESALAKTLATAIKQMNIQEPHGRENARHRPVHPAWRY